MPREIADERKRLRGRVGMIPPAIIEGLSGAPTSQQMRDAATELAFRVTHGEYDDLDEGQRADLESLAQILELWAQRVAELEAAMLPPPSDDANERVKP